MSSTGIIMKRFVLIPVIMALLVLQAATFSVEAAEEALPSSATERSKSLTWGRPSNLVDIGLGYLFSSSTSSWEISFPDQYGKSRSILDFKGMTGGIPIVFLDINHPNSYASLSFQFGKGQGLNGEGTDSDYLSNTLYYKSRFDVTGETAFWTADIQTTFTFTSKPRWVFKPFIGWQHYEEKLNMTDGRWITLYGQETNTPIAGLDSRYDFNWDALRVGISGELELASARQSGIMPLRLKSHLALFPYMHYSGRGVWNLRDDLNQDPSFLHEADNFGVLGMDGAISLVYHPLKFLEFEGGVRMSYFYVQDGTDSTYFSNNSVANVALDEAKTLQVGLFLKITGRF
jgi:hypothetical protein